MFNRHLEMKMVKNDKKTPDTTVEEITLIKFAHAKAMMKELSRTIVVGVVGYVVVDTLRQVIVAQATQKR